MGWGWETKEKEGEKMNGYESKGKEKGRKLFKGVEREVNNGKAWKRMK